MAVRLSLSAPKMKKFLQLFILEFIIVFIVGLGGYWVLKIPFNFLQILITSIVSGAIIALAILKLQN
jgi:hypothetical protein